MRRDEYPFTAGELGDPWKGGNGNDPRVDWPTRVSSEGNDLLGRSPSTNGSLSSQAKPLSTAESIAASQVPPSPLTGDRLRELPVLDDEVIARARQAGQEERLSTSMFVTWKLVVAVERGLVAPFPVRAVPLPPGCPPLVQHVYERFLSLFACRWLHTPYEPMPFAREFAAAWCGVSESQAREAIDELRRLGLMVYAGRARRAYLWLPRLEDESLCERLVRRFLREESRRAGAGKTNA